MRRLLTVDDLRDFAREHKLADFHEPDEQGISATVEGTDFDNAGFWPADATPGHSVFTYTDPSSEHTTRTVIDEPDHAPVELCVVFWRSDIYDAREIHVEPLACVNLATLCEWAVLGDQVEVAELAAVNELLAEDTDVVVSGAAGVRALVKQRDDLRVHVDDLENAFNRLEELCDRYEHNPNVPRELVRELRDELSYRISTDPRKTLTEAEARAQLSREIYDYALRHRASDNPRLADAVAAVINVVGDHVGRTPR
jgi:hypothetical protein